MKQTILLVNKHGRPSMKGVYQAIRQDDQFKDIKLLIKSSRFNGMVERQHGKRTKLRGVEEPDCKNSIVIRWGSRQKAVTDASTVVYNGCEHVEKTNSKGQCRKLLQAAGIAVPKTYLRNEDMSGIKFPCVGRPEHHGQGRQFYMCNNHAEIERAKQRGCTYFSEFYPKTKEYRIHCAHGKILAIMEKPKPNNDNPAWNRALNDAPFEVVDRKDWDIDLCKLALNAVKAVNLSFAAVDIMAYAGPNHPKAVICEINTAGTINSSPYVQDKYIKFFKWLFASDKRRPQWNFDNFKKATSLSWKEEQLIPTFEIPVENRID